MKTLAALVMLGLACSYGAEPLATPSDGCSHESDVTVTVVNQASAAFRIAYVPGGHPRLWIAPHDTAEMSLSRFRVDGADFGFYLRQTSGYDRDGPQVAGGEPTVCNTGTLKILPSGDAIYFGGAL